ncbi:phosphate ABC transporter permease PtsA [Pseudomonas sp. G11-1]|uniref:phosphate ABC transporter permease PstA n=1 Tax=Halopseudomonas sp. SMJS2 TaxID=3041098 RepID=UPI0024537312|nr:phosphate ABC transporter permease PstA [Halopseudomonas sp. SMJS2]MCO5787044.1 phosphate ABC transporter permease PtsA [Pseudomonas sp. G11-1]MCO5790270.1 phosphate ABC transporter permease PtsA [Pseudomonas sp. G11-2]WGK61593.1 phosphate ABC transporter permease PstA [Halopseudomonas sp. SMJS2]
MIGTNSRNRRRRNIQKIAFSILGATAALNLLVLVGFLLFIAVQGVSAITVSFLTEMPRNAMTEGGILPTILGTVYLSLGAILVAFPIGVGTAIYLNEFAKDGFWVRMIRQGVVNLAGVPSVVYGLFGLAFFVIIMKMGVSILAGALTLAAFILPLVIGSAEEALRAVPKNMRLASLALGATRWQTIYRVVLPPALPSMLTGLILGISRAAGETAPIMFTAAVFSTAKLPTSIFDEVMAMPYHIYVLATAGTNIEQTRHLQYGTALLLLMIVVCLNLIAILLRNKLQKKYKATS